MSAAVENSTCVPVPQDELNALLDQTYARQVFPVIVYLLVICPLGTVGNLLVLMLNGTRRNKSSSTIFILALAATDFLISAVVVPMKISQYYHITYTSDAWCKINPYLTTASILCSTFLLIAIAVDRFYAVFWPVRYLAVKKRSVLVAIASTLLLGGAVAVPVVLDYQVVGGIRVGPACTTVSQCYVVDSGHVTVLFIISAVLFFLSVLFMAVLYSLVYYRVSQLSSGLRGQAVLSPTKSCGWTRRSARVDMQDPPATSTSDIALRDVHSPGEERTPTPYCCQKYQPDRHRHQHKGKLPPPAAQLPQAPAPSSAPLPQGASQAPKRYSSSSVAHRQYRVAKLLLLVTSVFVLSWLPYWVLSLLEVADPTYLAGKPRELIQAVAFIHDLYFINNAANPIIYTFVQKSFRQRLVRLMRCLICRR